MIDLSGCILRKIYFVSGYLFYFLLWASCVRTFRGTLVNPDISWGFVTRERKRAWIQGARSEGDEGIYDNMSRRPSKRAWIQGARSEGDEGIYDNMSRRPSKRNAVETLLSIWVDPGWQLTGKWGRYEQVEAGEGHKEWKRASLFTGRGKDDFP